MGCSCKSTKVVNSISNTRGAEPLEHTILPGDSCIFCTEKHLSIAYTTLATRNWRSQILRQLVLGELECARRHSYLAYKDVATPIISCITDLLFRVDSDELIENIVKANEECIKLSLQTKNGKDVSISSVYKDNAKVPVGINPVLGELHAASAWRLASEVGYTQANRSTIISDLTLAQYHLHQVNFQLAERLRDIRHAIQQQQEAKITADWLIAMQNIDITITPAISDIKDKYGDDLAWYLTT